MANLDRQLVSQVRVDRAIGIRDVPALVESFLILVHYDRSRHDYRPHALALL
jgi:hypothetical protein